MHLLHPLYHRILKKTAAVLLSGCIAFGSSVSAFAAQMDATAADPEGAAVSQSTEYAVASNLLAATSPAQTTDSIELDGTPVQPEVYKINNENYFKLRDIAYLLQDTNSKFSVNWDAATSSILLKTGEGYTSVGGEMSYSGVGAAVLSHASVLVNGVQANMTAYNIAGNNYFRLRDIGNQVGFQVDYDDAEDIVLLDSGTPVEAYTVAFNMNGRGSALSALTDLKEGSTIAAPTVAAVSGYMVAGWYQDSGCTDKWDFTNDTVSRDMTLYAKWVKAYAVEFEMNGHGTQIEKKTNVPEGTLLQKPTPSASGYVFGGWYAERGCYTAWDFSSDKVGSDMVLYAKWTSVDNANPTTGDDDTANNGTTPTPTTNGRNDGVLTILIDAGHGGDDSGAGSVAAGVYEKDLCLRTALKLRDLLQASGVKVIMTRTTDVSLPKASRVPYIEKNADVLDLIVCIHLNSADATSAKGCEMLVPDSEQESTGESTAIAKLFLAQYVSLGVNNRGIKERPNLYMIKAAVAAGVPIAFSEYCFLSNAEDYAFVSTDAGLQAEAQAMYTAIMQYYKTAAY